MTVGALTISTLRTDGAVACLCLAGDLDLSTVAILQEALDGAEARSPAALVLDLSSLSFMDSTGLHCIARAHERAQRAGRRLVLVPGASCVERVVELTGLDKQLEFVTPVALEELLSTGPTVAVERAMLAHGRP